MVPIGAEMWLSDGGSWELEPVSGAGGGYRRRQTVAFFEKSELEGSQVRSPAELPSRAPHDLPPSSPRAPLELPYELASSK